MQCTQRKNTIGTYKKIAKLIPAGSRVLDYGAGHCRGAELLGADSFEPNPRIDVSPTYRVSSLIPIDTYDAVVCNCVLNVIDTPSWRGVALRRIVDALKPGGKAYIMVRSWSDVMGSNTSPEGDGFRMSTGSFQRGFSFSELEKLVSPFGTTERITEVSNIGILLTIPIR